MLIINDFFVRYKEAVSNQMELIKKRTNGKIISATRFMGQKAMQDNEIKDNIYIYSPVKYIFQTIKEVRNLPQNEKVHIFEEEPSLWKRILLNRKNNPLYISMYRRPNIQYATHLKKYKNLNKVFVELQYHKELLISYGVDKNKIAVTPTPSKIPREKSKKKYNPNNINIIFASWNNKEGDAIKERGLEYLLKILQLNENVSLTIPLRDNDTKAFEKMAEEMGVKNRIYLLQINNSTKKLIELFDKSDFVAFTPQKRIVKDVPNSLIDGLARGKPVIISDVIDFSNEVRDNSIGIVVEKGANPFKFDFTKQEYEQLSDRAFKYSERHSEENYLNVIEKAYGKKKNNVFTSKIQQFVKENNEEKSVKKEKIIDENSNDKYLGNFR